MIKTFDELDGRVLANMKVYLRKMGIRPKTRAETIRWAKRKFSGWMWGDNIYVKVVPSRKETLNTLIHELVHLKRRRLGLYKYKTPLQKLREETLATWVADCCTGRRVSLTRTAQEVARKYKVFN